MNVCKSRSACLNTLQFVCSVFMKRRGGGVPWGEAGLGPGPPALPLLLPLLWGAGNLPRGSGLSSCLSRLPGLAQMSRGCVPWAISGRGTACPGLDHLCHSLQCQAHAALHGMPPLCPAALGTHSQLRLAHVCVFVFVCKERGCRGLGQQMEEEQLAGGSLPAWSPCLREAKAPQLSYPSFGKRDPLHWRPGAHTQERGGLTDHGWQSTLAYKPALSHKAASLGAAKQTIIY